MAGEEDSDDGFGGLDQLADNLIQQNADAQQQQQLANQQQVQQQLPTQQLPVQQQAVTQNDVLLTELRTMFNGLPEGMSREDYVSGILQLQADAQEADALRQQIAELRAQQTAATMQQTQTAVNQQQVTQQPPTQQAVDDIPWKPVAIDPALKLMVKVAPDGTGYLPKDPYNPMHIQAVQEMTRRANYEHQLTNALFDNPEEFVGKLSKKQMAAFEQRMMQRIEQFESQFKPVQEHVAMTRREQETLAFENAHRDELFAGNELTPIANLTNNLFINAEAAGNPIPWETALQIAKSSMPAQVVQQQQSQSISKVATKPRFKDTLSAQSRVPNRVETQARANEYPTFTELEKEFEAKFAIN